MQLFFRLITLLLLLTTGGVFQTLAFASPGEVECAGEEADECGDCTWSCALCMCCPLRAAPASRTVQATWSEPELPPVPSGMAEPVLCRVGSDIFQPPRA
jgi:hypothetical protein